MRVLYVDADPDAAASVATALEDEREELSVVTATSVAGVFEWLREDRVDCIVSDYDLADTDGVGLLRDVRETDPDVPFVLFTAEGSEDVASEAYAAGATGYLRRAGEDDGYGTLADRIVDAVSRRRDAGRSDRRAGSGESPRRDRMFATLVRTLPGMVYRRGPERGWPMSFVSQGCADLTGYDPEVVESDAVQWAEDVVHPDHRDEVREAVRAALDRREPFEVTYRIRRNDGEKRWVWEQGRGVYATGGDLEAVEGCVVDVTDRKEREQELERYRLVVNAVEDGAFQLDPEGNLVAFNDAVLELTGYDRDQLTGEHVSMLLPPEQVEEGTELVRDLLDDDVRTMEAAVQTSDGDSIPVEVRMAILRRGGEFEGTVGIVRDISERKARERRLEAIFNQTFQFTGLLDPGGTILEANDTALEFGDVDREDVVGEKVWDSYWFQHGDAATVAREAVEQAAGGEFFRQKLEIRGAEGPATVDFSVRPVTDDDGEVTLLIPEGRDITALDRREQQLEALNEIAQALTAAESPPAICDVAVRAANETLDLSLSTIQLYDEDTGELTPVAWTDAVEDRAGDQSLFAPETDEAWQVFLEHEETVYDDLQARSDVPTTSTRLESAIVLPLGKHGVFTAGATATDAFSDAEVDLAKVLGAHTEVALDRVEREQTLRERTESLEEKTERLERIQRVNDVIRELLEALVRASSREEIEEVVPQRLAEAGPYRFAWVGTRDPVTEEVRPEASAGVEDGYLDAVTVSADDVDVEQDPAGRAVRTREPQIVTDIRTDPPFDPWRKEALARDYRSAISVPLGYEDSLYGTLTLYTDEPNLLDAVEQAVLEELGETIGYAINAVEHKKALTGDNVVELQFRVRDAELDLVQLVEHAGGEFDLEGVVRQDDGTRRVFFVARDCSPEDVEQFAADSPGIGDCRHVSGDETESVFEFTMVGDGLVGTILDHGAVPKAITAEGNQVTVVVELPQSRDVREFAEMFETRFSESSMIARRERDRPIRTLQEFDEEFEELLTDRQLETVKTAYFGGFFEWPRDSTGEEIAEMLEVSQPTFNRHLRASQRKLFELLFGDAGPDLSV